MNAAQQVTNAAATTNQLSSTANKLSYRELQTALKELREQGKTSIKLNSKQEVLEQEYERINNTSANDEPAVKEQCDNSNGNSSFPFCSNYVKVVNAASDDDIDSELAGCELTCGIGKDEQPQFTTRTIPAMNSKVAPSWLCRPYVVYVIDGVDYLPHELEMNLKGQVCQLPVPSLLEGTAAVANERKLAANLPPRLQQPARKDRVSKARQPQPIINTAQDLPKVKVTFKAQEEYNPYFIDSNKAARYSKSLGDVEKQAARNLEDGIKVSFTAFKYAASATKQGLRNVINFAKGFHARQVERASKVAA